MKYLRVTGALLALCVCVVSVACQQAVAAKEPDPEQPPATELLRGSWRHAESWTDDDDELVGMRIVTLTFTESRVIRQQSYVYDSGEPEEPWANASSGSWAATDDAVTITWYAEEDDELVVTGPIILEYFWVDVGSELLLELSEDGVATNEFSRYRKIDPVSPPAGSWTFAFENEEGVVESWTMEIDGADFRWTYRENPDATSGPDIGMAEVDQDEMFITVNLTPDDDEETAPTWRFAYAAGYRDDALALSPHWDEGLEDEETGSGSFPHPLKPYGDYWMLMRRDAQ